MRRLEDFPEGLSIQQKVLFLSLVVNSGTEASLNSLGPGQLPRSVFFNLLILRTSRQLLFPSPPDH